MAACPASQLVEHIVNRADVSNVGQLASALATTLKNEEIDDVFAALALVMVDVVLHYDTSHAVTLDSFRMLVKENVRNLAPSTKETLQ